LKNSEARKVGDGGWKLMKTASSTDVYFILRKGLSNFLKGLFGTRCKVTV